MSWNGRVVRRIIELKGVPMSGELSRRSFLAAAGTAAVSGGILSRLAFAADEPAQTFQSNLGMDSTLDYYSTRELVAMLAARRISAVELLESAIARIEMLDRRINAVVVRDFDRAHTAAVAADAALARGERAPLLGLPMTVKEACNVVGLPTTWGMPMFKGWMPKEDSVAVARLKAAGAIIIGKTNVPFAISDWQSYNEIYGTTNNPWDLSRTPGGSSGGAAAALAAGYVSLEIGSDIAGSIRVPAAFCGVFGHKPSCGVVSLGGFMPPTAEVRLSADSDLPVLGPLARTAADLALALDVLAGPDDPEAIAYRLTLPPARHNTLKDFRVLVIDTNPFLPTSAEIREALHRLSDRLVKVGVKVAHETTPLPDPAESRRTYMLLLDAFVSHGRPADFYRQMEAALAKLRPEDESPEALWIRGTLLSHRDWLDAMLARDRLRARWRDLFRKYDVVLCPIMPTAAFPHDHSPAEGPRKIDVDGNQVDYNEQMVWPAAATLPGLPATAIPIDRSEAGLPIGVQVIGRYLEDRTTIAFAELIEREFGGFVPPPGA
ncbi:MAG: amidase [Chthoniobacterales bacterium]